MVNVLELPAELLNNALSYLQADALVAFGRTSSHAHKFINTANSTLWKHTFLNTYDNPPLWTNRAPALPQTVDPAAKPVDDWDYFFHLRQRTSIRRLITGQELSMKDDYTEAIQTILSIIETAKTGACSLNLDVLADLSERGKRNLDRIIHARQMQVLSRMPSSDSINRPVTRSTMHVVEQPDIAARLHVLYGLTAMEKDAPRLRGVARRLVYDWSLTGPKTDHGPFKLDGSGEVNWQLLEAACSTISRNFSKCADGRIIIPQGFHYSVPYRTLPDPTTPGDWAGAQGIFVGTYAFLDYADLHLFNIGQRNGQRTSLEDEREACGDLMSLELKLDPSLESDSVLKTNIPICNDLPMLYFSGVSIGFDGAYRPPIGVRGTASLVPGGREVRWRFLITYGGEDQWQLEGVQAGGVRSGGIYGIWSHVGHTPHGPTGPFCYFPSELCKRVV